jgi:hypothetical protein
MAIALDAYSDDGEVMDVLEECDQLAIGLGRLRRQREISEQDWRTAIQHLAEIRQLVDAGLTP